MINRIYDSLNNSPDNFKLGTAPGKKEFEWNALWEKITHLASAIFTTLFYISDEHRAAVKTLDEALEKNKEINFHHTCRLLPLCLEDSYAIKFAQAHPNEAQKYLKKVSTYPALIHKAALHINRGEEAEAIVTLERAAKATTIASKIKECEEAKKKQLTSLLKRTPENLKELLLHVKYKGVPLQRVEEKLKGDYDMLSTISFLEEHEWLNVFTELVKTPLAHPHCEYAVGIYGNKPLRHNPIAQYREGMRLLNQERLTYEEICACEATGLSKDVYFKAEGHKWLVKSGINK